MLRIGICDDSAEARFTLKYMLERQLERREQRISCYEFSSGEGLLQWLKKHPDELDVLFLDIEMQGMSGMEAARNIRTTDMNLMLIFVTGFVDYVFDGYTVNALDYLLKPVTSQKLDPVIKRILGVLELRAPRTYSFKNTEGMFRIPMDEIHYLQSEGRVIHLVTAARRYTFYEKLDAVHAELGTGFVRIHQRYLVRCGAVDNFTGSNLLVGGQTLPVSRSHRTQAMEAIAEDMLGREEDNAAT